MKTKNYKIDDLIEEAGEFLTKGTLDKEVLSAFMRIAFMRGECTQIEKDIKNTPDFRPKRRLYGLH